MVSQQRLFTILTMFILIGLLMVACERPLTSPDDTATDQTTQTGDPDAGGGIDTSGDTAPAVPTEDTTGDAATDSTGGDTAVGDQGDAPAATVGDTPTDSGTEPTDDSGEAGGGVGDSGDAGQTGDATQTGGEDSTTDSGGDAAAAAPAETSATIPATHTVAAGENLYRIGLKYGISWVAIANANNLANPNILTVGQVLNLPGASTPTPTPTPSPQTETTYIVRAGDNLYRIGLRFGISWVQIAEANGLVNPNVIKVGNELKIPVNTPGPAPQFSHVVKQGETLFLISLQYGVAWPAIAEANNLASPYVIYVGQTLVIPGSQ